MLGTQVGFRCYKSYPGLMQISHHTSTSTSTWEHVFPHSSTWRDVGSSVPAAASSSSAVTDRTKCQPRGKQTTGEEVMWRKGKRKTEEVEGTGGLGTMRFERDFYEGTYKHNAICFALWEGVSSNWKCEVNISDKIHQRRTLLKEIEYYSANQRFQYKTPSRPCISACCWSGHC